MPTTPLDLLPGRPAEPDLTADCSRCFAPVLRAAAVSRAAGFGVDKPGGRLPAPRRRRPVHASTRRCASAAGRGARSSTASGPGSRCPGDVRRHVVARARRPRRDGGGAVGDAAAARDARAPARGRCAVRRSRAAQAAWDRLLARDATSTGPQLLDRRPRRAARRGAATSSARPARGCAATAPTCRRRTWPARTCAAATCATRACAARC